MTETLKVMVIDDNIDDRDLCKRALLGALGQNLKYFESGSGDLACEEITLNQPECVLLDYSLPSRNGIEVLKRIRAKHAHVPVIILTGQGNETVAVRAMQEGAQDYIIKSNINAESLYHLIKIAIERCRMKHRIEEQQQALALFTRALAHDLKEPLRTILSFVGLIEDGPLSHEQQLHLGRVANAAQSMEKLIQTVRLYTELADCRQVPKSNCDFNAIIKNVFSDLGEQIAKSKAHVRYGKLPAVVGNEAQLVQVLQNLISNAIFYSDKSAPAIQIDFEEDQEFHKFSVKDNGPGIEEEHLNNIFDSFKRYSSLNKEGLGLGLAICKKIIEHHGGNIWCESQKGKGTEFHFTLVKGKNIDSSETHKKEKKLQVTEQQIEGTLANILFVDDNISDIYLMKTMLLRKGKLMFNWHSMGNGKEAVDFLKNKNNPPIDLVMLDVNMPIMDGFEFLKYRKEHQELQICSVVICSTSDYSIDKQKANELGAYNFITKPLSYDSFVKLIQAIPKLQLVAGDDGVQTIWKKFKE